MFHSLFLKPLSFSKHYRPFTCPFSWKRIINYFKYFIWNNFISTVNYVLKDTLKRWTAPQTDTIKWSLLFFYYIVWLSVGGTPLWHKQLWPFPMVSVWNFNIVLWSFILKINAFLGLSLFSFFLCFSGHVVHRNSWYWRPCIWKCKHMEGSWYFLRLIW